MKLTKSQLKEIVLEEVHNRLVERHQRLLEEIILEEIELYLLREELVRLNEVLLNEGIMNYLNKLFGGDEEKWKEIVDGAAAGKSPEEVLPDRQTFLSWPAKRKVALLALVATIFAGGMDFAIKYYDVSTQAATSAQMVNDTMEDAKERAQSISNFRDMAAQEAASEGGFEGPPSSPEEVNRVMDDIRANYYLQDAPLDPATGMGYATGQGQATDYAFVPASDISDDTVLPFAAMTKADYETLLRVQWLSADSGGDQRLIDLVTGGDKPGSSTFWSYQDSLQAPVIDHVGSSPEMQDQMLDMYGERGAGRI
jgi:hypothetical protein